MLGFHWPEPSIQPIPASSTSFGCESQAGTELQASRLTYLVIPVRLVVQAGAVHKKKEKH